MNTEHIALIYIFSWVFALSLPWVFKACTHSAIKWRLVSWVSAVSAIFVLGYLLDQETLTRPHQAYTSGTFYVTYLLMSILITTPSVIYFRGKQQNKK